MISPCPCDDSCSHNWSYNQVFHARNAFYSQQESCLKLAVFNLMHLFWDPSNKSFIFRILGLEVCASAFCIFHGISKYLFYQVQKCYLDNIHVDNIHGNRLRDYSSDGYSSINAWLSKIKETLGDADPASSKVYLPPGLLKVDAYHAFVVDQEQLGKDPLKIPSESYFRKIWNKDFAMLKIVRKNRLGVCDICAKMDADIAKATSARQKREYRTAKYKHIQQVKDGK